MTREAHASTIYEYRVTEVIHVVDADTIDLALSLGFGIRAAFRFRLHDVDAPEVYGAHASDQGREARAFVEEWLSGRRLHALTFPASGRTVGLGDGAFGRWLVELVDSDTGESLADALRERGWS